MLRYKEINMGMIINSKEYYYDKFNELFNSGDPIMDNTTKETFDAAEGEIFKQCYADTPERRTFPVYWFVSNRGNLISVRDDKLVLIHKNKRPTSGKYSYKYVISEDTDESVLKNIELHNLVGLVFGSDSYGMAAQKIKDDGVYAFGVRSKEGTNIQGHHRDGNDTNNDPSNIEFMTDRVHTLFDSVPKPEAPEQDVLAFMKKFGDVASAECPDAITVYLPGQTYNAKTGRWETDKSNDIVATKSITVTDDFVKELETIVKLIYEG